MQRTLIIMVLFFGGVVGSAQQPALETKIYEIRGGLFEGFAGGDQHVLTVQDYLKESGIAFPEGTRAKYDPGNHRVAVTHSPGGLAAVKKVLDAFAQMGVKQIVLTVEIFEVDALAGLRTQQQTSMKADHTHEREALIKAVEDGTAKLVVAPRLICRSGQRGKVKEAREVIYATEFDWDESGDISIPTAMEQRDVGTIFEADPVLGSDDFTVDTNFAIEHHTAPPILRNVKVGGKDGKGGQLFGTMPEFHAKQITTSIVMFSGQSQLVGSWKPTGTPVYDEKNLSHLVFLTANVIWAKVKEVE